MDHKTVRTPQGAIDITEMSKAELKQHAEQAWQEQMLKADNRGDCGEQLGKKPILTAHASYLDSAQHWLAKWVALGNCPDWIH